MGFCTYDLHNFTPGSLKHVHCGEHAIECSQAWNLDWSMTFRRFLGMEGFVAAVLRKMGYQWTHRFGIMSLTIAFLGGQ